MDSNRRSTELDAERTALDRIRRSHLAYLARTRRIAEGLAADAAEAIEDGIRDIIDEDAEADAAVRAVLVRQSSQRAMYAARRVADLEAQGDALAFGHMTDGDGGRLHIGRRTVLDGDEPLLVDWRARASIPFYRATPVEPLGLVHRRHLIYDDPSPATESTLIDYSDELFDLDAGDRAGVEVSELRGEAALLASLRTPTGDRMRSVVATIQAEQDAVVRARADRTLVVQGGPGTGKTVIALHRAAYLLYDQREELADSGVLLVGPSRRFLQYIAGVLPSLGESGVVSVTVANLYRGASLGLDEDRATAEVKGRAVMADLLAYAVEQRQRVPRRELRTFYGSRSVRLGVEVLERLFTRARRHRQHNDGASSFRSLLIDRLSAEVYDPAFHNLDDARASFAANREIEEFLLAHFPPLSPEQALNDLLGSPALLAEAGAKAGVTAAEVGLLARPRTRERDLDRRRWSDADAALLDELLALLGPVQPEVDQGPLASRDEVDEFDLAAAQDEADVADHSAYERADEDGDVAFEWGMSYADDPWADDLEGRADPDRDDGDGSESEVLFGSDDDDEGVEEYRGVVESDGEPIGELDLESVDVADDESVSVVELASEERSWQFGHVIVDEAQDLTPMQWRMVVRRSTDGALTIVGDLAQRSIGADEPVESWLRLLPPSLAGADIRELTINYRSPIELDDVVQALAARIAPALAPARSLRRSGRSPRSVTIADDRELSALVDDERDRLAPNQRLAVIGADRRDLPPVDDDRVSRLDPVEAKGLEFDSVIVVDPDEILGLAHGLGLLYIAVTRTTSGLVIAHRRPLPEVLARPLST